MKKILLISGFYLDISQDLRITTNPVFLLEDLIKSHLKDYSISCVSNFTPQSLLDNLPSFIKDFDKVCIIGGFIPFKIDEITENNPLRGLLNSTNNTNKTFLNNSMITITLLPNDIKHQIKDKVIFINNEQDFLENKLKTLMQ